MRIAHIFWSFTIGGAETMLVDIINRQVIANNKLFLIIINNNVNKGLINKLNKKVKVIFINRPPKSKNPFYYLKFWMIILINHFNILHCHNSSLIKLLIGFKNKSILTVHDVSFDTKYFKYYKKLFAISNAVKSFIKRDTGLDSILIYNGINFDKIRKKSNYKFTIFNIVQVSRLDHKKKGQHILILSIEYLVKVLGVQNIKVTFIGTGESEFFLKNLVNKKQLQNYISFVGEISKEEIYQSLYKFDLLIQPSIWEGFGLTIVEAMAAKVPLLVPDIDGPIEIIKNGVYGHFFKSEDHISCAEVIFEIIRNYSKITDTERMDLIYNYAFDNFNIDITTNQYLKYYV